MEYFSYIPVYTNARKISGQMMDLFSCRGNNGTKMSIMKFKIQKSCKIKSYPISALLVVQAASGLK